MKGCETGEVATGAGAGVDKVCRLAAIEALIGSWLRAEVLRCCGSLGLLQSWIFLVKVRG